MRGRGSHENLSPPMGRNLGTSTLGGWDASPATVDRPWGHWAAERSIRVIIEITGLKQGHNLGSGSEVRGGAGEIPKGGGAWISPQRGGGFGGAQQCPKIWRGNWPS